MRRRERVAALLTVFGLVVAVRLAAYLFAWYAHTEEREALRGLRAEVEAAGVGVVRTQLEADSLLREIEALDRALREERGRSALYERMAEQDRLSLNVYRLYRSWLDGYNETVEERNRHFERWREVVEANHREVERYNTLADSIRRLAESIGDPYFEIPSPAEAAVAHGVGRGGD